LPEPLVAVLGEAAQYGGFRAAQANHKSASVSLLRRA
jgi:hypothetical protein